MLIFYTFLISLIISLMMTYFENPIILSISQRSFPPLGIVVLFIIAILIITIIKYRRVVLDYRNKEKHINAMLDSTPDLKFILSRDGTFLDFHTHDSSLLYIPPEGIIGNNIKQLIPEISETFMLALENSFHENKAQEIEYELNMNGTMNQYRTRIIQLSESKVLAVVANISENEKTGKLLKESEARYRGLIESQTDLIVRVDKDGCFTFVNDAYCNLFGKSRDELIGKTFIPLVHEDDIAKTLKEMEKLKKPPYRASVEQRAFTKDGWRWLAWEDSVVLDDNGNVIEIQGVGRDVTDYKDTISALEDSKKLNDAIIKYSPLSITVRSKYGQLLSANKAWQDYWNISDEQMLRFINDEKNTLLFDDQDAYFSYLGEWKDEVIKIYKEGGRLHIPELKGIGVNNQTIYATSYFYAIKDSNGKVDRVITLTEDITESKDSVIALARSEKINRTVIDQSPLGMTVRDKKGHLLTYNKAWKDIWQISDKNINKYFTDKNKSLKFDERDDYLGEWQGKVKEIYEKGGQLHIPTIKTINQNGATRWISHYFYSINDEQGKVELVVVLTENITERIESIIALEKSEELKRTVIDQSPIGITIRDKQGQLLTYNKAWQNIWQISSERINDIVLRRKSHTFEQFSEYLKDFESDIEKIYKDGGQYRTPILEALNYSGEKHWISHYMYAINNKDEEVDMVVSLTVDHTEQKEAEMAMRESEEKYRSLLSNIPVGVFRATLAGSPISINKAMSHIYGYDSIEEMINTGTLRHYKCPAQRDEMIQIMQEKGHVEDYELEMKKKDGTIIWVSASLQAHYNDAGELDYFDGTNVDITERKKAEVDLIASEIKHRSLVNNIPVGIYRSTIDGTPLSLNPAMATMYGYNSPDEMLQIDVNDNYIDASNRDEIMSMLNKDDIVENLEKQYKKKDGSIIWVSSTLKVTRDENNKIIYFDGIDIDITERKIAELAFKRERETLNSIIESNPYPIALFTEDGYFHKGNKSYYAMFGVIPPQHYCLFEDVQLEEQGYLDHLKIAVDQRKSFEFPEVVYNASLYNPKYPDKDLYLKTNLFTIFTPENEIEFIVLIYQNITEQRQAILALKESEEKFRTLAEYISVGVVIYQEEKLVYVNPQAILLTGYTEEEMKQMDPWALFDPSVKYEMQQRGADRFAGKDVPNNYELPLIDKNGKKIWVFYSAALVTFDGKPAIISTVLDITQMRETQIEIKRLEQEKYKQVKEIAGGVAHEIYNSLFPASSSIEVLKQRIHLHTEDDLKRNETLLNLTESSIRRAVNMTELVTEFSKLDNQVKPEVLNIADFFNMYLVENQSLLSDITVKTEIPDNLLLAMNALHFHSLIHNLMINAIDALKDIDDPKIEINSTLVDDLITIHLIDNGAGIPKEIASKIFDSFFSTKPYTGTGLGLAICKKIVSLYSGDISYQPSFDNGAHFTILLKTSNILTDTQE